MTLSKRAIDKNRRGQPPPSLSPVVIVVIVVVINVVVVVIVVAHRSPLFIMLRKLKIEFTRYGLLFWVRSVRLDFGPLLK